jgi:uncharacterized protein YbbK (DUF523 family)
LHRERLPRLRLGVSACLLGEAVRYDGGHKLDSFLTEILGRFVEWVPVCPEVEVGLGTPRPAMQLVRIGGGAEPADVRLITRETGADHTAAMRTWAVERVEDLAGAGLDGYVLKSRSPSCGPEGVKLFPEHGGEPELAGRGLFAEALLRRLPDLPVEEESRLSDPLRLASFLSGVFRRYRRRTSGSA